MNVYLIQCDQYAYGFSIFAQVAESEEDALRLVASKCTYRKEPMHVLGECECEPGQYVEYRYEE